MAIVFQVGTTKTNTAAPGRANDGDMTVDWPTGYTPTAGHFALIILYNDQGSGSVPTDWTQVTGSPWGSDTPKLQAFYKVLAGGESAPVTTISGSGTNISHCANMAIYAGVDGTTPVDAVGTASAGTGTPMTAGGIDPPTNNAMALGLCGRGDNESANSQTFGGSGTGVTEQLDGGTNAGNDSEVSMYDKLIASSATGDGSSTTSITDPWVSVILALRPGLTAYTLTVDPGSYTVNGGVATAIQWGRLLNAEPVSFVLTGAAAATLVGYLLNADPDAYLVMGVDATLVYESMGLSMNAEPGGYLIMGSNAEILVGRLLVAEAGAYTLIGFDATLAVGVPGTWMSFGREFLYTAANWTVADIALEVYMRATSGTVRARLYDVTDDAFVSGTILFTASSSFARVRSTNLKSSLIDGHAYRVQFGKENPDTGEFLAAQLVAF